MRAVLVQNMREKYMRNLAKYALKYAAYMLHICGITEICGVNDARARVFTLDKTCRNAEKCDRICGNMRLYANFCKFMH